MRIKIDMTIKEREHLFKLCSLLKIKMAPTKGKWGCITPSYAFVEEKCFIDFIKILTAMTPKIISLFDFVSALLPIIKDAFTKFGNTWYTDTTSVSAVEFDQYQTESNPEDKKQSKDKDKKKS